MVRATGSDEQASRGRQISDASWPWFERRITSLEDAARFIQSLILDEPRNQAVREQIGLAPIELLLERLGNPHHELAAVHIAGSKGKGSTGLVIEHLALAAGRRPALFTSPHLSRWTERYRVDGAEISPALLTSTLEQIRPVCAQLAHEHSDLLPSFFDVLTAAAFVLFKQQGSDLAIMETGLGGRLDATNVVTPRVSCITSIELEHTDKLGNRVDLIAAEKAGIIKPQVPVVVGALPASALAVVRAKANSVQAPCFALGHELLCNLRDDGLRQLLTVKSADGVVTTHLSSTQSALADNFALGLIATGLAFDLGHDELSRVARSLHELVLPGRLEFISLDPKVLVDGAHTTASIAILCQAIDGLGCERVHLLVSVSGNRDAGELLAPLIARSVSVTTTCADPHRSMDADELADTLRAVTSVPVASQPDPVIAAATLRRSLHDGEMLVATGSMYLAGSVRSTLA